MLGDGWAAHLEMSRNRVHGAIGLKEEIEHPASRGMANCSKDIGLAMGSHHHVANIRKQTLTRQVRSGICEVTNNQSDVCNPLLPPSGIDWVCVSPKAGTELVLRTGDELKLIFPQPEAEPDRFVKLAFTHFYLQPMDGPFVAENTRLAVEYCMAHPQWQLSLQTQKILGIP